MITSAWHIPIWRRKRSRIPFRDQDLFLAQKIEVGVTAGTRIDDGGKVPGKIVGVTSCNPGEKQRGPSTRPEAPR